MVNVWDRVYGVDRCCDIDGGGMMEYVLISIFGTLHKEEEDENNSNR